MLSVHILFLDLVTNKIAAVIKLKQVEHVRNENKTLGAVSGHPFITTLVASFSDDQSLYMLVCLIDGY